VQPALTPLLLIAEKHLRPELQASRIVDPWLFSSLVNTVWGTTLVASFAILAEPDWDLRRAALSAVPVAALLVVYVALVPRTIEDTHSLPLINVEKAIAPLSLRVLVILVVALGMQTVVFGLPSNEITPTLTLGFAKALSWYFTIRTVCSPLSISRNF
jgi:hypothetical protein